MGHLLAGAAIGGALALNGDFRRHAGLGALAAIVADLDFIPGAILGDPARFHHAISHSLLFVGVAGLVAVCLAREARGRWALIGAAAYGSHLLLDFVTLDDSVPQGIPLFWPFSSQAYQSPVSLLPNVEHVGGHLLGGHNILLVLMEIVLFGSPLLLVLWRERRARGFRRLTGR